MLFNSPFFIFIFLPISLIGYFFLTKKKLIITSKIWICSASLTFYAYWNIDYLYILLISIIFNYLTVQIINSDSHRQFIRKVVLSIGIAANLLALSYYKYMDFFIKNINHVFKTNIALLELALPLAISFFTFQQIAFLVDSYKGKIRDNDFINYALCVTFFPHLIAGPILHYAELMPQVGEEKNRALNYKNLSIGIILFTIGLFKKTVMADTFSEYVKYGFNESMSLSMIEAWLVSLSYTFQIYFDFSGCSDMAIGIGKMFNFNLPINFNSPYKADSIVDFWKRWHMTLSRFFRDYVYIPFGGNRDGEIKTYRNLWITFLLTGIWHGASWMFVLWGAIHGIALTVCKLSNNIKIYFNNKLFRLNKKFSVFITFLFVNIAWVFFRAENGRQAKKVLQAMLGKTDCLLPRFHCFGIKFVKNGGAYL
jgi:D-alanyl-lipoteichoic acid acyltransferase DltB (MBOAT superfamily)